MGLAAAMTVALGSPAYAVPFFEVWVAGNVLHGHHGVTGYPVDLTITPDSGRSWTITTTDRIDLGAGCRWVSKGKGTSAVCSGKITRVEVRMGPADDRLDLDAGGLRPDVTHVLFGGMGDDTLLGGPGGGGVLGGPGNDHLDGRGGNDTLIGDDGGDGAALGADVMFGGAGHDVVDYLAHPVGIRASLDGVSFDDGGPRERDTLGADIEDLWGTCHDDVLIGNSLDNYLWAGGGSDEAWGLGGNDTIRPDTACPGSGTFASDYIDGGAGSDTIQIRNSSAGSIYVDLDDELNDDGYPGEFDSYIDMENIDSWATGYLVGNDEPNVITGGNGAANIINGMNGDDTLGGGDGDDILNGGDGDDVLHGDHPDRTVPPTLPGGEDYLFGGTGADFLDAGPNGRHVEGGDGSDTCVATTDVLTCEVII